MTSRRWQALALVLATTAPWACSDDSATMSATGMDAGMDAGTDAGTDAVAEVSADTTVDVAMVDAGLTVATVEAMVFTPHCATPSCHAGDMPTGSMNLEAGHARTSLVGVMANGVQCRGTGAIRVLPGDPEGSLLVHKIEDAHPPCGSRMPLQHAPLDPALQLLVRQWVTAGAP